MSDNQELSSEFPWFVSRDGAKVCANENSTSKGVEAGSGSGQQACCSQLELLLEPLKINLED